MTDTRNLSGPVYTIGHSTRTIPELAALLGESGIQVVADVRAIPRSRTNPQFNLDVLPVSLEEFGIGYQHFPELGGRRHHPCGAPPSDLPDSATCPLAGVARSCARRRCGGAAIVASSATTCSLVASP